jgi:putative ABC transport system permease protein
MNVLLITSSIELGLLYSFMTLGLFISYRILDIPDLTVDSSFTLGAAVSAVMATMGYPLWGIILGALAIRCYGKQRQ